MSFPSFFLYYLLLWLGETQDEGLEDQVLDFL